MTSEWLLTNGVVWTGTDEVEAIAIRGDRIIAIGSEDAVAAAVGSGAQALDLTGHRVIPGLIDSHVHFLRAGTHWNDVVRWDDVATLEGGLARIREQATRNPPGTWIRVLGGWHPQRFPERRGPTAADLDAVAPEHPVYVQLLYEEAYLNRTAVEAAPDDVDATKGTIRGPGAFASVLQAIPAPQAASQRASIVALVAECTRFGLTGVVDPGGFGVTPQSYEALLDVWKSGDLDLRVRLYHVPWRRGSEVDDVRYWLEHVKPGDGDDWLRHVGLGEIFVFGSHDMEGLDAFFVSDESRAELIEITTLLAEAGWPGHLHAILDSTVDAVLDAWEAVAATAGPLPKLSLAHAEFIGSRNLGRVRDLGVGIAVQDRLAFRATDSIESWGTEAVIAAPPLRDILDLGIPLGAGTDATVVTPLNPWLSMWWLVTGRSLDGAPRRVERHRLSRAEALHAYTSGSAWFSGEEHTRGTLAPGMLADLAVLSDDFFTVDEEVIPDIRSVLTMIGGRVVHSAAPFQDLV